MGNLEAEELVTAHRIEKPATSSQGNEQAAWNARGSQEARNDITPMDVQTLRSDDTHLKKRPRVGDSPEVMNTQEIREQRAKRGLAGARQLVDHFGSWMSDQIADVYATQMSDEFWGMVNYPRDCCEDVAKQMAFLEGRLAERTEMKDLIKNELQLLIQERPRALNTG